MDEQAAHRARKVLRDAGHPISFQRGDILMSLGAPSDHVLLIESGFVNVVLSEQNGTQVVAGSYGRGELIGELGVLNHKPRSATVIAQRSGVAVRVLAPVFRQLAGQNPDVMVLVTTTSWARLQRADTRQLSFASRDVPARVAAQLLEWAEQLGEHAAEGIKVRGYSQADLANAISASTKSVDTALRLLRAKGLVWTSRLTFALPDPMRLRGFAQRPRMGPGKNSP